MATDTVLGVINVFESEASYKDNAANVGSNELSLVRVAATLVETWSSGANWYRKWSDGWIEQGGSGTINECSTLTVSLNCAMATKNYTAMITNTSGKTSGNTEGCLFVKTKGTATIVFSCGYIDPNASPFNWYVCGY